MKEGNGEPGNGGTVERGNRGTGEQGNRGTVFGLWSLVFCLSTS